MGAKIAGSIAVVTGGNRGIGRAFVTELLARGATKVYCGARSLGDVDDDLLALGAVPLQLDVTDTDLVAAAAETASDATVIINNAGYHSKTRLVVTETPEEARQEMEVNYFGVLNMTRAFAPVLGRNGGGAIVNVLSVAGALPVAFMGGYSPAKGAALYLSSITRSELAPQDTSVTALIVGSVATRMSEHVEGEKESPESIAIAGLKAMERGVRIADTDPMAVSARAQYSLDPVGYVDALGRLVHKMDSLSTKK